MTAHLRILILEDQSADAEPMLRELRQAGFEPDWQRVDTEMDYLGKLSKDLDVILADYSLPQFDALRALHLLQERDLDVPFIIVTSSISEEVAVECMKQGAADYLLKDRLARLGPAVTHALQEKKLRDEKRWAERELTIRHRLADVFLTVADEEMYGEVLQIVLDAMESQYGIFGYVDENGSLICPSTTRDVWDQCLMPEKDIVFPHEAWGGIWGQALIEKKSLYSNDPFPVPEEHIPILRALDVPIIHQGEVIGNLLVGNKITDYDEQDQELLEAIASYIAPVLNARLQSAREKSERQQAEEALRRRNRELAMLHRAGQALTSNLSLSQVLVTVLEEMRGLLDATSSSAWLIDSETDELVCHRATDPKNEIVIGWRLPSGEGIAGWVTHSGESLIVPDTRADERHFTGVDQQTGLDLRSILCVPLRVKQTVIGVLQAVDTDVDHFNLADLALAEQLAATAAIAIDNARLYEQARQEIAERRQVEEALERYAERLKTLHAIDEAILAARSLEEVAKSALHHIRQLVPCRRASVVIFDREYENKSENKNEDEDEEQKGTVLAILTNGKTKVGAGTRYALEASTLKDLQQGKVHMVEDIPSLSQPSPVVQALHAEGLRSYITVPLIAQGKPIGSFNLGAESPGAFAPEHIDIAREIADEIAVALYQTRLRQQVQHHVQELEQRVAERTADLSAANAELSRAARLKDEFLASMSHELRTPLNAILGLSEALQEEIYGPLNERQLKSLHTIEASGRHLLTLINDILDVSKIEAGKLELTIGPTSVESVCQASLGLIKQNAHRKRLKVFSSLDSEVTTIQADRRRLKQILVNLLSNAVKFTPEGETIGLEVVGDAEREVVHFTVWDTGIGIAPEEMEQLFKPFVQLDSSLARQQTGTGLGLVLIHRMTEMHGGGIAVESEPGKGSRFTVSLPWQRSALSVDKVSKVGGPVEATEPPLGEAVHAARDGAEQEEGGTSYAMVSEQPSGFPQGKPLILLAEDNEDNIYTILDYLLTMGYRVIVARNGAEAVERALEERPDLILMDIQMPEMGGLEATRRIRADAHLAGVPIIALTALAMPGDRERCLEAGANDYLSKPVGLKGLIHVIEAQLEAQLSAGMQT